MLTEADTCRKYVVPKLQAAGWDSEPHSITEQRYFTDGRIIVFGSAARRRPGKRADYILRFTRDYPIAVVEAKRAYKLPADGLGQAKEYAQMLGLKFAYSTNGHGIVEFDFTNGTERELRTFPSPQELWDRLSTAEKIQSKDVTLKLLQPYYHDPESAPRYYQEIAINRVVQAVLQDKRRVLLTMATGTGKTVVAFQICWKLWNSGWNRTGSYRKPKILYLADRNILVDDPKDKTFVPFGDARLKIRGEANKSREMYFATYQAIARDEHRPGLYKEFGPDFFDLIIVDECHRGSATDESNWREILTYFKPSFQLGMTATPLRQDNRDTYLYFGNPVYTYTLRRGIEDGFLAPYRVHRVVSTYDATGWRPSREDLDRYGRQIPDELYETRDFERIVALRARTEAIAQHLTTFLKNTDRFAKTIVFCVDQEHALAMRAALVNLNSDLVQRYPDYVCRVTAAEGEFGRAHLGRFQEPETTSPVILTTSQLLTTGVDAPTCKNIVLARVINSMTDFKQIIGRGTRVREDYNKLFFNILDYTGSATRLFADPDFDGEPARITEEEMNNVGETIPGTEKIEEPSLPPSDAEAFEVPDESENDSEVRRKYYFDGGQVEIAAHMVYELDPEGKQLRVVRFTDYTGDKVRTLYPSVFDLRQRWGDPAQRSQVIQALEERGIALDELRKESKHEDADPFDLLCHIAFNSPIRSRRERAEALKKNRKDFFQRYAPQAREVLEDLLEKYATYGTAEFELPETLQVPPISARGTVTEITGFFGGAQNLRNAVNELQTLLYAS